VFDRRRENWGYGIWFTFAVVVAVPEIVAWQWRGSPFPTISGTIGDLEYRWPGVAAIIVALLAAGVYGATRFGPPPPVAQAALHVSRGEIGAAMYFFASLVVVAVGTAVAAVATGGLDRFAVGRTLYGLIALLWLAVPSLIAWRSRRAPFPTLFEFVRNLEQRVRWLAYVFVAGLSVLLIHLALYPWPAIIPDLQRLHNGHAARQPTSP
jgi:hypothetical protein